jgi:hypothetical protein
MSVDCPSIYLWFIKFFEKEEYADQFMAGHLYLNTLTYFKELESKSGDGRDDSTEAIAMWWQPNDISIKLNLAGIGDIEITRDDLAGPASMSFDYHNSLNILSLYTMYVTGFEPKDGKLSCKPEDVTELRQQLAIDRRCFELGKFAVVTQVGLFIKRLREALQTQTGKVDGRLVDYYDKDTFHGKIPFDDIPFRKQKRFSYQREYRLCVDSRGVSSGPIRLNIGDISTFSAKMESVKIPDAFTVTIEAHDGG